MMSQRSRPDHWTVKARKMGYPARSVFKLQEIQEKWSPMKRDEPVLDVGAAPGSWTLFAMKTLGRGARVTAVDLKPLSISPPGIGELRFRQGDVFTKEAAEFLAEGGPYGCVLSDAAPATSGNRLVDSRKSYDLVMRVIDLAQEHLAIGGNLVVKIFQGGDEQEVRERIKGLFAESKTFKPKAVRSESMETYIIGRHFVGSTGTG